MSEIAIIFAFRDRDLHRVKLSMDSLAAQSNKGFRVYFVDYGSKQELTIPLKELLEHRDGGKKVDNMFCLETPSAALLVG